MAKKPTIKVLSMTFKVGNKTFTALSETNLEGSEDPNRIPIIPHGQSNIEDNINTNFRCIDGVLHMNVCVGGACHWVSLNKPCK